MVKSMRKELARGNFMIELAYVGLKLLMRLIGEEDLKSEKLVIFNAKAQNAQKYKITEP